MPGRETAPGFFVTLGAVVTLWTVKGRPSDNRCYVYFLLLFSAPRRRVSAPPHRPAQWPVAAAMTISYNRGSLFSDCIFNDQPVDCTPVVRHGNDSTFWSN